MKRILFIALFIAAALGADAQSYKKFTWKPAPMLQKLSGPEAEEPAVYLEDDKFVEYKIEKEGLFIYKTLHRLVHLNNDKGIESFNKIYLPFGEGVEVMEVRARSILPNGRIIVLDEKNIKELEEDGQKYKIFAIDGLAKGCEVEYYYTLRKQPIFFGREQIANRLPVLKGRFELRVPKNLKFDFRSYHGLPEVRDTVIDEQRVYTLLATGIKAIPDERYAMQDANVQRIEYKLSYNLAQNANERLFSWDELARKVHEIYTTASDKEMRKVKEVVEAAGIKAAQPAEEKVKALERYLKKNFVVNDELDNDDAFDLASVVRKKTCSKEAICRLFCLALKEAGVPFEAGLSGDRSDYTIERKFENWNNARNFVVYFPGLKKYVAPSEIEYRYPFIPPTWAGTTALFAVTTTLGNFESAFAELRNIALEPARHSYSNMTIKAALDANLDSLVADLTHSFGGYYVGNYRLPFVYLPQEEHLKIVKQMMPFGSEQIRSWKLVNPELDQPDPYKPFEIVARVHSSELVEKAGKRIIIKVGELIGEQAELYDTTQRTTDIELSFPHGLNRVIEITLPKGYVARNLKDLEINNSYSPNGTTQFDFVSSYTVTGNVIRIDIRESYNGHFYPKNVFDVFRGVINASADFNKVALILEPGK